MDVVFITGGLGNQMFSYAFFYVLSKKKRFLFTEIDMSQTVGHHNGFELSKPFLGIKFHPIAYYDFIRKVHSVYFTRVLFKKVRQINAGFISGIFDNNGLFSTYKGFWQSESYFKPYEESIRKLFVFDQHSISARNKAMLSDIGKYNSVSIHIRRGDYLDNNQLNNVCTPEYYKKAIQLVFSQLATPVYLFFRMIPTG